MKKEKTFDCLKYKEEAQARLNAEMEGLSLEERLERTRQWGETSDSQMAKLWRRIGKTSVAAR
jgi:hypothetical protein